MAITTSIFKKDLTCINLVLMTYSNAEVSHFQFLPINSMSVHKKNESTKNEREIWKLLADAVQTPFQTGTPKSTPPVLLFQFSTSDFLIQLAKLFQVPLCSCIYGRSSNDLKKW